ncbi:Uma2 family endonuclease [Chondromyces crocatus]|nr:Uma2 family endonuclease [Chondromyces crocatus]
MQPHQVAEIIRGTSYVRAQPGLRHVHASSELQTELGQAYCRGRGGPGGWRILQAPQLQLGHGVDMDVLVPDLAGWTLERLPQLGGAAFIQVAPDWVCEVLSPGTAARDRAEKMPIYARERVKTLWLVDPSACLLEVFVMGADGEWRLRVVSCGAAQVRATPFDAVELDLSMLWTE